MSNIYRTTVTSRPVRVTTTAAPSVFDLDRDALNTYRVSCDNPRIPTSPKPPPLPRARRNRTAGVFQCANCKSEKPLKAFALVVPGLGVRSWWCKDCEEENNQ